MRVVWSAPGTRDDERKLKKRRNSKALCPKCKAGLLRRKRKWDKAKRKAANTGKGSTLGVATNPEELPL